MHLLKEVYSNFSGAFTKPGDEKFMSPTEFEKIFVWSGLINERFANRDVNVCYNLAMQARIDEIGSDTHLRMSFIEFMEALGRAADYLSLGVPSDKVRDMYLHEIYSDTQAKEQTDKMKEEEKLENQKLEEEEVEEPQPLVDEEIPAEIDEEDKNQPLHKKIEHIIPYLLAFWTSKPFKKKWKWPRKNPHNGFFTDVKEKGVREVKTLMVKGMNRLIFSKLNLKEIVKKKGLNIQIGKKERLATIS